MDLNITAPMSFKDKGKRSVNYIKIDSELNEKINLILKDDSNNIKLINFLEINEFDKFVSYWAHYSLINDNTNFNDSNGKLLKLVEKIVANEADLISFRVGIINSFKSIINNHMKIVYRCLNNKNGLVLKILKSMIEFDSIIANEIFQKFDFSLSIIPKLLENQKNPIDLKDSKGLNYNRFSFISFFISLGTNLPYFHRKDLLTNNPKIINNLWKFIMEDNLQLVKIILQFFNSKVLQEINFKRSTKCKILNENFMHKIQLLFNKIDKKDAETYDLYISFLEDLTCTSKFGLIFPNDKIWQTTSTGVIIKMNNINFRINNNLIYIFLTTLKPWESFNQMSLTIKILKANHDLVPIYMNWMIQHGGGYHDPALSSWWIGRTLLYSNILQLPLPEVFTTKSDIVSIDSIFQSKIILENISLAPITKSSLIKGLDCDKMILIQFSLQLILYQLKKLKQVLKTKSNFNKQELIELVFDGIPDITKIIETYNRLADEENFNLIKLSLLIILKQYEMINPSTTSNSNLIKLTNVGINSIINHVDTCSDYDLVLLDCFLTILSIQDKESELKWWNRNDKDTNSLFTSMIKLSTKKDMKQSFASQILLLLSNLTSQSLLFKEKLLISPIFALIKSFKNLELIPISVWKLIDEAISRSVKTPYKYIDLSHGNYNDTSIFIIAIFEQIKFVLQGDKDNASHILSWFYQFLRLTIICGETKEDIINLAKEYLKDYDTGSLLELLEFNKTSSVEANTSFGDLMINTSNKDLSVNIIEKKVITSKYDFAATISRIQLILKDKSVKDKDSLIILLFSKISNFILSANDEELTSYCLTKTFYNHFLSNFDQESILIFELLNELYNLLPKDVTSKQSEYSLLVFNEIQKKLPQTQQKILSNFTWMISNAQLEQTINNSISNDIIDLKLGLLAIERSIKINIRFFNNLLSQPGTPIRDQIVSNLIECDLVNYENVNEEMNLILSNKANHIFIKNFINSNIKDDILLHLIDKDVQDKYLTCYIAYSIGLVEQVGENSKINDYFKKSVQISIDLLKSNDPKLEWKQLLVILSNGEKNITQENKSELINLLFKYIETHGDKYGFISEFADLMIKLVDTTNSDFTKWLHKSMLYITKMYAELDELNSNFDRFLQNIEKIVEKVFIWKLVPTAILNTQLEVFFNHKKWIKKESYLHFASTLVSKATNQVIEFEKLIQIFTNNESNVLKLNPTNEDHLSRVISATIISNLFNFNPSKLSNLMILDNLLLLYLGSIRKEDQILRSLLMKIEAKLTKSWMIKVRNWELVEESEVELPRLVTQEKLGFTINISKKFIKNLIKHNVNNLPNNEYDASIYDIEFLLLLILNNEELVKIGGEAEKVEESSTKDETSINFNLEQLISNGLLQLIVLNINNSNENVRNITKIIIQNLINNTGTFKDGNIYKVYLSNLLFSISDSSTTISEVVIYMYSNFANILNNPGHFLYEKVFRYVLSTPKIKDIPLFHGIQLGADNQEDFYYKEVRWLIETVSEGISNKQDLELIKNKGFIEWVMNLLNSPYLNQGLKTLIYRFLSKIQSIDQGSDLLITRFGALSQLELEKGVNVKELALRFGISIGNSKRIKNWTAGDLENVVKRVCKEKKSA